MYGDHLHTVSSPQFSPDVSFDAALVCIPKRICISAEILGWYVHQSRKRWSACIRCVSITARNDAVRIDPGLTEILPRHRVHHDVHTVNLNPRRLSWYRARWYAVKTSLLSGQGNPNRVMWFLTCNQLESAAVITIYSCSKEMLWLYLRVSQVSKTSSFRRRVEWLNEFVILCWQRTSWCTVSKKKLKVVIITHVQFVAQQRVDMSHREPRSFSLNLLR